jgi:hypothetical protein
MSDHASEFRPAGTARHAWRRAAALVVLMLAVLLPAVGRARGEEPAKSGPSRENEPKASSGDATDAGGEDPNAQGVTVADGDEARMVEAFAQLADPDADVREAARTQLMGLERRYLPALQKLVERSRPLLPSQAAVLRQIVTHVYLAGEPYAANGNMGFLGVRMLEADVSLPPRNQDDGDDTAPDDEAPLIAPRTGVVITERMPGFVGNRMLLDGDVIIGLADRPELRFQTGEDFSTAVRQFGAGRTIRFNLLRRGRLIKVAVPLDPRPEAAVAEPQGVGAMTDLLSRRRQKADAYWAESFAPLLKERLG